VIARRNEALGSGDQEFAVGKALCRCLQRADVRARARFGQAHRAGPFAGEAFFHVFFLLFLIAVNIDEVGGAVGQTGIHTESVVGRTEKLHHTVARGVGNALPADFGRIHRIDPAGFAVFFKRFTKTLGYGDHAVFEMAAFFVPFFERRKDNADGQLFGLAQNHQQIILGKSSVSFRLKEFFNPELLKKKKLLIACVD